MDAGIEQHLAAGRHARAFDLVVPAYKDRVFRLAYSILNDRAAAEDATQETLVRVWKALPGFDGRAALGTWIYAITRNTCLMELRRRRPSVSFDDPDSDEAYRAATSIATAPPEDPERDNLLRLVDTLPVTLPHGRGYFIAWLRIGGFTVYSQPRPLTGILAFTINSIRATISGAQKIEIRPVTRPAFLHRIPGIKLPVRGFRIEMASPGR